MGPITPQSAPEDRGMGNKRKVLYIEDEQAMIDLVRLILDRR